jgi:5-methylcytosine-specific restriction endonuclease McrA
MKLSTEDRAWAKAVKQRDKGTCRRCEKVPDPRGLHAHHIFTRSRRSTRHDLENGVSLCYGDHRWAHSNPLEFHAWMQHELGMEAYLELKKRSVRLKKRGPIA